MELDQQELLRMASEVSVALSNILSEAFFRQNPELDRSVLGSRSKKVLVKG